jgi:hypothetical protein
MAVTAHRTMQDVAQQLPWVVDARYPRADVVRVVLDNLNTHQAAALSEPCAPAEARRILTQVECHYTPKHGSWLNMAERELSIVRRQCLDRRIPDAATLQREVPASETSRNDARARMEWQFTSRDARMKLHQLYPSISA